MIPSLSLTCSGSSQNLGKHLLLFTSLLKDMVKDTDEQPDEGFHRAGSGRVPSTSASVPSWYVDVFTNLETLQTPYFRDIL